MRECVAQTEHICSPCCRMPGQMNMATLHGPGRPCALRHTRTTSPAPWRVPAFVRVTCAASQPAQRVSTRSVQVFATGGQDQAQGPSVAPEAREAQAIHDTPQYTGQASAVPSSSTRALLYTMSALAYLRRLHANWSKLNPKELGTSLLFVLGVILVNYGIESSLDFYLGDSPLGSLGCILFGAGVVTYIKLMRIPVSRSLLAGFWN